MSQITKTQNSSGSERLRGVALATENRITGYLRRWSVPILRSCLGAVFVWFGALKVADATPVADLVAGTVPWLDRSWFVPVLGGVEVLLGIGLLLGRFTTVVCALLVGHLCGTFLVLVMEPQLAFQRDNPLLLTTVGEFVVKNLVLISAALVIAAWSDRPARRARPSQV
ncbi:DoxX family membrane protein [Microlunatus ginsengisoli]|uniref:DoxX protein n=1 Tax=Microlunatus ginsengisoli TaxID=363863 RepID=A0ABP7A1A5_9ACTN